MDLQCGLFALASPKWPQGGVMAAAQCNLRVVGGLWKHSFLCVHGFDFRQNDVITHKKTALPIACLCVLI